MRLRPLARLLLRPTVPKLFLLFAYNMWQFIEWQLGFAPYRYLVQHSRIVSRQAAQAMFDHLKQTGVLERDLSAEREECVVDNLYSFARRAIFAYAHQVQVQAPDVTAEPKEPQ